MSENTATREEKPKALQSVDDVKPDEEGGPIARSGFKYQDEIAVSFLIEMLENPSLVKVHCETHDDVLLVWALDGATRLAEFVQVKASELDKLWSVADLCATKKNKSRTSIYEISLGRDKHVEESLFRIVTLRPVVTHLKMLTLPRDAPGREPDGTSFKSLQSELDERFPGLKSLKGNGASYWLENCLWDVCHSENSVRKDNLVRILKLGIKEDRSLLPEHAEILLDELRAWAKAAGDAKWEPDRDKKIIACGAVREWWERRTRELSEGAAARSGGKLREKMIEAGLSEDLVELAVDMRRDYAAVVRTSQYMELDERKCLQGRVNSEVVSLRARLIAGQLELDGPGFHLLCLDRMDVLNRERPAGIEDQSAFLKGCMYDIADRCLLRFARPV